MMRVTIAGLGLAFKVLEHEIFAVVVFLFFDHHCYL